MPFTGPSIFAPGKAPPNLPLSPKATYNRLTNVANVVNGGVATSSGDANSSFPVTAINNGDRLGAPWGAGGGWNSSTNGVFPDWCQVDFNASYWITEIDIITIQDAFSSPAIPTLSMTGTIGIKTFEMQYWDGSSWVTVPGGSISNQNKIWYQFQFPPIFTQKIRCTITAVGDGSYSRVAEMEAWAGPTPQFVEVSLATSCVVSLAKAPNKAHAVASSNTVSVLKQINKPISTSTANSVSLVRRIARALSLLATVATASIRKQVQIAVSPPLVALHLDVVNRDVREWNNIGGDYVTCVLPPDDEDATYMQATGEFQLMSYVLESNSIPADAVITSVELHARVAGGDPFIGTGFFLRFSDGIGHDLDETEVAIDDSYSKYVFTSSVSYHGSPWTLGELSDLKVGIGSDGALGGPYPRCTTMFVIVNYETDVTATETADVAAVLIVGRTISAATANVVSIARQVGKLITVALSSKTKAFSTFTASNGTQLIGSYVPEIGPSWTGGDANYLIQSNQLNNKSVGFTHAILSGLAPDVMVQADVVQIQGTAFVPVSFIIRRQDGGNYWEFFYDQGSGWQLDKVKSGADNFIGAPLAGTTGTIKFQASGNRITATGPTGATISVVDNDFRTQLSVAIILRGDGTTASIIDNFTVTEFVGVQMLNSVSKLIPAVSSANVATIIKRALKTLTTVVTANTASIVKQANKSVPISSANVATITKRANKAITVNDASTVSITRLVAKSFSISTAVGIVLLKLIIRSAFSVASTNVSTVSKQVGKVESVASSESPTVSKRVNKSFTVASANQTSIAKLVARSTVVVLNCLAVVVKLANKALPVTSAEAPAVVLRANKGITSVATETPVLTKQAQKNVLATGTGTSSVQRQTNKFFTTASAIVASIVKRADISPVVTTSATPTIVRQVNRSLSVQSTAVALAVAVANKVLPVSVAGSPTLRIQANKVIAITASVSATILRLVYRLFRGPFSVRLDEVGRRQVRLDSDGTRKVKLDNDGKRKLPLDDQ